MFAYKMNENLINKFNFFQNIYYYIYKIKKNQINFNKNYLK